VLCTPLNRLVALDAATGKERWSFDPHIQAPKEPKRLKCLGVAYWHDTAAPAGKQCAHRILAGTNDRHQDVTVGETQDHTRRERAR